MAEQLETYGPAGLKRESLFKLTLSLKIYMISEFRTTTQLKLFIIDIAQKYLKLKTLFEESGIQKIFQKLTLFLKNT